MYLRNSFSTTNFKIKMILLFTGAYFFCQFLYTTGQHFSSIEKYIVVFCGKNCMVEQIATQEQSGCLCVWCARNICAHPPCISDMHFRVPCPPLHRWMHSKDLFCFASQLSHHGGHDIIRRRKSGAEREENKMHPAGSI
jgi:hypothetical protein